MNALKQLILDLNKFVGLDIKVKEPVSNAKYWNNKWTRSTVYYSAPSRKKVTEYVQNKEIQSVDNIAVGLVSANLVHSNDPDGVVLECMRWFKSQGRLSTYLDKKENWQLPQETLTLNRGDCLPEDTLLLKTDGNYVKIKDVQPGDCIIGRGGNATLVINKWDSGIKPILILKSQRDSIKVSPEHKMFVNGVEKKATDVLVGDNLDTPDKINVDSIISIGYDTALLLGLFIADGWWDNSKPGNLPISGKDGCKKEKQKLWVKQYCLDRNIPFYWHRRYISVKSRKLWELAKELIDDRKCFRRISFDADTRRGFLEGLKADASERKNELTYSTIKKELALQIRSLWKMEGKQCSLRKVVNHGGFGKNPIYRIGVRRKSTIPRLVKSIELEGHQNCFDIETENGGIYLPEYDIEVHNCDDHGILLYYVIRRVFELMGIWHNVSHRLKCMCGNVNHYGSIPSVAGGHFYLNWLHNDGYWYTVESTYYLERAILNFGQGSTEV